ncbi:endonuclease/exonuclease/phosphatase family protein [Candidatus Saccharibacteria bacterium]|nr:endonuclease/exonuclease/phosphatase family protein [Candidatus Saccharibacteria bacterium]
MVIKLLQWNIWFKENIDNILTELRRFDTDIVCLQELSITTADDSNAKKLKELYPFVYYEIADTFQDGRSQCNAILSKYPFLKTGKHFVQEPSDDKNDYSKEGRVYLEAQLDIDGKEITIGTTHLSYTHKFEETPLKDEEINKLVSYINKKERFIFTGDLNTTKTSKYIKQIEQLLISNDTTNTWTTKPFSYQGFNEDKLNWKLDYVFSTPDIQIEETKTLETRFSDHLPILCVFDF